MTTTNLQYPNPETIAVKHCPFCGKTTALNFWNGDPASNRIAVICSVPEGGCGGEGGFQHSAQEAARIWNQRARNV